MRVPEPVSPDAVQPLRDLWRRYGAYRTRFVGAVAASTVNKVADVVPELLIGAAVDVVVRGDASFVGEVLGVESRFAQLGWLAVINVVVWLVESVSEYVASVLWRGLAQGVEHDLRVEAYDHVQHLDLGLAREPARRARRSPPSTTTSTSSSASSTSARRRSCRPRSTCCSSGPSSRPRRGQLLVLAFLPIPLIVIGSLVFQRRLEPLYDRVRAAVADLSSTLSSNISGHRDHQGVHRRGPRARPRGGRLPGLPPGQHRRDPLLRRVRAAGPDGDPGRLHLHAAARWLGDAARRPRGRPLLRAGLHDAAPALAADRGRRGPRPLPARPRVDRPHPGPARRCRSRCRPAPRPSSARSPAASSCAAYVPGTPTGPTSCTASTCVVPAGETHAIVGSTGSGKSSLLRLVLRFDDPREGTVLLRRAGRARPRLGLAARLARLRRPGRLHVRRLRRPTTSPTADPTPPASRSGTPPRRPPRSTSSRRCPTGWTPGSASGA